MQVENDYLLEHALPHDADAERAICGFILDDNRHRDQAMGLLTIDDFYVPSCRRIFTAICEMEDTPIDLITMASHLKARSTFEAVGGFTFLSNLTIGLPKMPSIAQYATQIVDKSLKRRLIKFAQGLTVACLEDEDEGVKNLHWAQSTLDEMALRAHVGTADFESFADIAVEVRAHYGKLDAGEQTGLATGYPSLDRSTRGGIHPGQLWVISALTGRGKSAWMIGAARHISAHGNMVGIISREMSKRENFIRAHSPIAGVPVWKIAPGINAANYYALIDTIDAIGALPIHVNTDCANIYDIRAKVRKLHKQGARVLFVDYLQLLSAQNNSRVTNRSQEVAAIARTLKEIAMDLNIGVVALAQFNRGAANSEKPELHQLADSSEIENASDITLILDMEEPREGIARRKCSMRIAKHRNGPQLSLKYEYDGNLLTFSEVQQ